MANSKDFFDHRNRLRNRFIKAGKAALADYELLELLLYYSIPRKDTKPLAKILIKKFGSFSKIFDQPIEKLKDIPGIGHSTAIYFLAIKASMTRYLQDKAESALSISSPKDVKNFVRLAIGSNYRECLMALYLNSANHLIRHEIITEGTVDQAPVYYREILKRALIHDATAIILVHNHPSGNVTPSREDNITTEKLSSLAAEFNINLYDHLIVCPSYAFSIKNDTLI